MKVIPLLFLFLISLLLARPASASYEFTSDPQYVVMNFATINELNWGAEEKEWKTNVRPQIVSEITEMRTALENKLEQEKEKRMLAFSTLMEYMNFPLDEPTSNSVYAIKMRRIMEICDELDLPIFIPLNGFQWWDQLPELYNWWDPDGTRTDPKFFSRQKNPEDFKKRFIAGYNPTNIWNVEWQGWQTPMKLNYRNWGGGGFRLAPPPNLSFSSTKAPLSYKDVMKSRIRVIIEQIKPFIDKWEKEDRLSLLAGISIGTEISLNASVLPSDEFLPYGYRAAGDLLCAKRTCDSSTSFSKDEMNAAREQTVNDFLTEISRFVASLGIPKQRLYAHVWGEAEPNEPRYVNYAKSSLTLYSRPGMSFYGHSEDPLSLSTWKRVIEENGVANWGAIEYSAGSNLSSWQKGLSNTFDSQNSANIMVIYNWQEHKKTPAISAIRRFLAETPKIKSCKLPEIFPRVDNSIISPESLEWRFESEPASETKLSLHIQTGIRAKNNGTDTFSTELANNATNFKLPELKAGSYSWFVKLVGCDGKILTSQPRTFVTIPKQNIKTPFLVNWILDLQESLVRR